MGLMKLLNTRLDDKRREANKEVIYSEPPELNYDYIEDKKDILSYAK